MGRVLVIKANPKVDEQSNTFKLLNVFLEEYLSINTDDELIILDLYKENIYPINQILMSKIQTVQTNKAVEYAQLFASCDKYIIAAPMWNLGFPGILKIYFDYIAYQGITIQGVGGETIGLLNDKKRKALHIVSRGGTYTKGPAKEYEQGDRYIRKYLNTLGIQDIETLAFELTHVLKDEALEQARNHANDQAKRLAQQF